MSLVVLFLHPRECEDTNVAKSNQPLIKPFIYRDNNGNMLAQFLLVPQYFTDRGNLRTSGSVGWWGLMDRDGNDVDGGWYPFKERNRDIIRARQNAFLKATRTTVNQIILDTPLLNDFLLKLWAFNDSYFSSASREKLKEKDIEEVTQAISERNIDINLLVQSAVNNGYILPSEYNDAVSNFDDLKDDVKNKAYLGFINHLRDTQSIQRAIEALWQTSPFTDEAAFMEDLIKSWPNTTYNELTYNQIMGDDVARSNFLYYLTTKSIT
jgi:hypothetical protein